jgi:imidazolonepropionase-like amidohydrolase
MGEMVRFSVKVKEVIDGTGKEAFGPAVITVGHGKIESVQLASAWEKDRSDGIVDPSIPCIDCSNWTALPGFFDCHVHMRGIPVHDVFPELKGGTFDTMVQTHPFARTIPEGILLLAAVRNGSRALSAGITTIRDCGSRGDVMYSYRQGVKLGIVQGPRVLMSGPMVSVTGGHGASGEGEADGPDETRKITRQLIKKGVDFIKVAATGGLASKTNPGQLGFSVPELQAITDEAHRCGLMVAAHILGRTGIITSLEGNIDSFEHVWFLEPDRTVNFQPDLVHRMVDKGVVCCPTPATEYRLVEIIQRKVDAGKATDSEVQTMKWSDEQVKRNVEIVMFMHEAGLKLINGTDAGVPYIPFDDYALPLELLVEAGLPPMEAIKQATSNPAEVLGVNAGTLVPGKIADICLLEGNPLEGFSAMRKVRRVIKEGELVYTWPGPCTGEVM